MKLHPQRCETCTGPCPALIGTFFETRMDSPISEITALVGCASHSKRLKGYHDVEEFYKDEKE